jgi:crotonobetainyl-CoA:carnitine CoA-transferase CaiB-like acyl-CoA transferase
VSTPLHQAIQRMIEWQCPVAAAKGRAETRMANNFPMNAGIANMHPTGDGGYVAISAVTQATAERLMTMVGGPDLAADPRFATPEARMRGLDALYAKIDAWTGARSTAEIMAIAAVQDVVLGPIYTTAEILSDPQIAARGNIVSVADGNGGTIPMPGVTPRLTGFDPVIRALGPSIGRDDVETCLQDVEVTDAETADPVGRQPAAMKPLLVIELGAVIAGPFAGSLLADFGCRVIKVESPGEGDSLRKMGPVQAGVPLWFATSARDKECVSLNLKHPAGKAMFAALIAKADLLVENFRPGVLERLGLGWDDLTRINPRLVMVSISGFGQTGPQRARPGFGKIAEGLSGVVSLTGEAGQAPLFVGFSLADASAGLFGVFGASALLYARDVLGGAGGRVDLALYEPLLRMLDCQLALHAAHGVAPARSGGNDPASFGLQDADRPLFRCVESASRDWYLIALPETAALDGLDAMALAGAELEAALRARGLEFIPVFDGLSMAASPYFAARRDVVQADHPALGRIAAPGRLGVTETDRLMRPPAVGEDNARVFAELLGLAPAELDRLAKEGVV